MTTRPPSINGPRARRMAALEAGAHERWRQGMVVPHAITAMLDMHELYGPEVDLACAAVEPDVDRWEAGRLYPRWDQLVALAELTCVPVSRFTMLTAPPVGIWDTSMRFHLPRPYVERVDVRAPVTRFPDVVVARCPGTALWASYR